MSMKRSGERPADREHVSDQLPDYVRGELTSEQRTRIEAHLRVCRPCAEELDLLAMLEEAPPPVLTAEEREELFSPLAIRPERRRADWRSGLWKAAAAIAVVATGYGAWQVYLAGGAVGEGWGVAAVLQAWEDDVREIDPSYAEASLLLTYLDPGASELDYAEDVDFEAQMTGLPDDLDVGVLDGIDVPWEEGR